MGILAGMFSLVSHSHCTDCISFPLTELSATPVWIILHNTAGAKFTVTLPDQQHHGFGQPSPKLLKTTFNPQVFQFLIFINSSTKTQREVGRRKERQRTALVPQVSSPNMVASISLDRVDILYLFRQLSWNRVAKNAQYEWQFIHIAQMLLISLKKHMGQ